MILAFRKEREIEGICKSMVGWTQGAHRLFARFTFQMATSPPPQVPIPNLSRGENLALQHRRIIGAVRIAHNPRHGIVSVPSPGFLQRFFTKRFTTALVVGPGLDTGAMIQPGRFLYINTQSHCRGIITTSMYFNIIYVCQMLLFYINPKIL